MSNDAQKPTLQDQAIAWVVRAHASDMSDDDIIALTAWLESEPEHQAAFDAAERAWVGELSAPVVNAPRVKGDVIDLAAARQRRNAGSRRGQRGMGSSWLFGSLAAGLAVLALLPVLGTLNKPVLYQTSVGQTREVVLKDGTRLHLNSDTRIAVRFSSTKRDITLDRGELALDVVHDANRPLSVMAGDQVLRDVGTVFDVLRHDGAVTVTVKSGAVALLHKGEAVQDPAPQSILHAGDQAVIDEASGRAERLKVPTGPVFDWERGQVVYRNRSLAYVVGDLNRYFAKPIEVDAEAGKLNVTAVLTLDSEASVVRHLQDFLPVEATETDKAIRLRKKPGADS